jgi:hypothetical protein
MKKGSVPQSRVVDIRAFPHQACVELLTVESDRRTRYGSGRGVGRPTTGDSTNEEEAYKAEMRAKQQA